MADFEEEAYFLFLRLKKTRTHCSYSRKKCIGSHTNGFTGANNVASKTSHAIFYSLARFLQLVLAKPNILLCLRSWFYHKAR